MPHGETPECDFSMLLSQELIAKVMEQYLNKVMLKQHVEVVDLQNTEAGYVFSLKHLPKVRVVTPLHQRKLTMAGVDGTPPPLNTYVPPRKTSRNKHGRFAPKEEVEHG